MWESRQKECVNLDSLTEEQGVKNQGPEEQSNVTVEEIKGALSKIKINTAPEEEEVVEA